MNFNEKARDTVNLFEARGKNEAIRTLKEYSLKKREEWYKKNKERLESIRSKLTLKDAFNIFYFEYVSIDPKYMKIKEESERRITVLINPPCDILDACKLLGFDTKEVCRKIYEELNNILLSWIHPNLRFRSYQTLRPESDYCEESIEWVE